MVSSSRAGTSLLHLCTPGLLSTRACCMFATHVLNNPEPESVDTGEQLTLDSARWAWRLKPSASAFSSHPWDPATLHLCPCGLWRWVWKLSLCLLASSLHKERTDRRGKIQQDEAWAVVSDWLCDFTRIFLLCGWCLWKWSLALRTGRPRWRAVKHAGCPLPCRTVHHQWVREELAVWWKVSQRHAGWVGSKLPHLSCVYKVRVFTTFSALFVPTPHSKVSGISPQICYLGRLGDPGLLAVMLWDPNSASRYNLRIASGVVMCQCGLYIPSHVSVPHTDRVTSAHISSQLHVQFTLVACSHPWWEYRQHIREVLIKVPLLKSFIESPV